MTVELNPRSERLVKEQLSGGNFQTPEEVIEQALLSFAEQRTASGLPAEARGTLAKFDAFLDALTDYSDKIPALPGETFSREAIYQDHD